MKDKITPTLMLLLALLIVVANRATAQIPIDASPCYADFAVSFAPGNTKGGVTVANENAFSVVTGDEIGDESSISLGFNGEIIIGFSNPIPLGAGDDLLIDERDDSASDEKIDVYVSNSLDDTFELVGSNISGNGFINVEIPGFTEVKYVKLVEISDPADFANDNANGYDIDRVISLHGCGVPCATNPTAELTSDIVQCPDGSASLDVTITGTGPWDLGYSNGTDLRVEKNINLANASIPFDLEGLVGLDWVTDRSTGCTTILEEGNTTFITDSTRAYFQDNQPDDICLPGARKFLRAVLIGKAPWSFTYSVTHNGITETFTEEADEPEYLGKDKVVHQLEATRIGEYELLSVEDACMTGVVEGKNINLVALASAQFIDPDTVCNNSEDASLNVALTGSAPWQLTWEVEGVEYSQSDITTPTFTLPLDLDGQYILKSVQGSAECGGTILEDSIVNVLTPATAQLFRKSGSICNPSEETTLTVQLNGSAPVTFAYTLDGEVVDTVETELATYEVTVDKPGAYQLAWVQNACGEGTVGGDEMIGDATPTFNSISHEIVSQSCNTVTLSVQADSVSDDFEYEWYADGELIGGESTLLFTEVVSSKVDVSLVTKLGLCTDTVVATIQVEAIGTGNVGRFKYRAEGESNCEGQLFVFESDSVNSAFTYQWKVNGEVVSEEASLSTRLSIGTYNVQLIINEGNCQYSSQQQVEMPLIDLINLDGFSYIIGDIVSCNLYQVDFEADTTNSEIEYQWLIDGKPVSEQASFSYELTSGEFEITLKIVLDECQYSSQQMVVIEGVSLTNNGSFDYETEAINCSEQSLSASALDLGEELQYQWWLNDELIGEQERISTVLSPGEHVLRLTTQVGGCRYEVEETVSVASAESLVNIPNVLSPQAAQPDDQVVKVYGRCFAEAGFLFQIIDRWGDIAYETASVEDALSQGWDGGDYPSGVYTYILRGQFDSGSTFQKQGKITLIK